MKNHDCSDATAVNGQKKNRRGAGSSSVARVENVHMDTKGEKNYTATMTRFLSMPSMLCVKDAAWVRGTLL